MRLQQVASYFTSSVDKKSSDDELSVRLCNYTDVYYQERIREDSGEFMSATASAHEIARFGLQVGDVLITKDSEDWRDIAVPALVEKVARDFVCGYHLGIIRPSALVEPSFLFRAMQSAAVNQQLQVASTGVTRYGVQNAAVSEAVTPLPPLAEQRQIAAFLDRATARIDELVAANRLLIERLDEYRSALITQTVTGGLPAEAAQAAGIAPATATKPSGVGWIGDVPEHWEVRSFRNVCQLAYGDSLKADERIDGDVPVFGSNGVVGTHIESNTLCPAIVVGRKGSHGKVNFSDAAAFAIDTTYFVDARQTKAHLRWLYYVLASADLAAVSKDSAVPGLARADAYAKWLPYPPIREQRAIAAYLDHATEHLALLSADVEMAMERSQEYRSSLVTAAVTGKIDVRGEVPAMSGGTEA
ncbi:restriction endonuclease subunit S [Candidatus Poriferisodalis sp.]|uniref:restriction endonuclease subunit S n=1 Tax=Candidatus Poriferisodalis sp. TaxID=3101277 RepID=UPI003B527761